MQDLPQAENEWEWRPVVPADTEAAVTLTAEDWGLVLKAMDVGYTGLTAEERDRFAGVSEDMSSQLCEPLFLESWNDGSYLPGHPEYEPYVPSVIEAANATAREAIDAGLATELYPCWGCGHELMGGERAVTRGILRREPNPDYPGYPNRHELQWLYHLSCGHTRGHEGFFQPNATPR